MANFNSWNIKWSTNGGTENLDSDEMSIFENEKQHSLTYFKFMGMGSYISISFQITKGCHL